MMHDQAVPWDTNVGFDVGSGYSKNPYNIWLWGLREGCRVRQKVESDVRAGYGERVGSGSEARAVWCKFGKIQFPIIRYKSEA